MTKVVKKFGGTSLADEEKVNLAVEEVIRDLEDGVNVTVVVSAMGSKGDPYATDTLIDLLEAVSPQVDPQKKDLMMACGEIISASLFAHYLDKRGYPAVPLTGYSAGIFTDDSFGNARVIDVDPVRVEGQASRGKVPVLAGFQGRTVDGEITTLGRGGSDTTALVVGDELGVDRVEIYTDVPGLAVTEPDLVGDPPFFSKISREALLRLTENGARIVHPPAVEKARESGIPIVIKSSWDPQNETVVTEDSSFPDHQVGIAVKNGYTTLIGDSRRVNRDPDITSRAKEVFYVDEKKSLALIPEEVEPPPEDGFKRVLGVALVTVVATVPGRAVEIRRKVLDSLPDEAFIESVPTGYGLQLLVDGEDHRPLVRRIYEMFYRS